MAKKKLNEIEVEIANPERAEVAIPEATPSRGRPYHILDNTTGHKYRINTVLILNKDDGDKLVKAGDAQGLFNTTGARLKVARGAQTKLDATLTETARDASEAKPEKPFFDA